MLHSILCNSLVGVPWNISATAREKLGAGPTGLGSPPNLSLCDLGHLNIPDPFPHQLTGSAYYVADADAGAGHSARCNGNPIPAQSVLDVTFPALSAQGTQKEDEKGFALNHNCTFS